MDIQFFEISNIILEWKLVRDDYTGTDFKTFSKVSSLKDDGENMKQRLNFVKIASLIKEKCLLQFLYKFIFRYRQQKTTDCTVFKFRHFIVTPFGRMQR